MLFAGFSAYFTATSLSLNLLAGTYIWLIFLLVLVISILAGWCLTNAIEELSKLRPSKAGFILNVLGFLIFWTFSFTTNVHYFFVEKHGYSILVKELTSAKTYIVDNTEKTNKKIDDDMNIAKMAITAQIQTYIDEFERELRNTMDGHVGFGDNCISILKSAENALTIDAKTYEDNNEYKIFDDVRDAGDRGVTQRSRFNGLQTKYTARMLEQLNKKLSVIENFYERKKDQNTELTELLEPISELEAQHLPAVEKDGSVNALYKYYHIQDSRVIAKMPKGYDETCVVKSGDQIKKFNVYPSKRMFDTMSVWGDIFRGRLGGMTMIQWIVIAFIVDLVAFILFALFRR